MFPEKPRFLQLYLQFVLTTILAMPLVTIALWALFLFSEKQERAAISVILLGCSALLFSFGIMKIKWNNWRFKKIHRIILLVGYGCFTAWQFFIVFSEANLKSTYTGLSAIFLTQNGVCATLIIFINLRASSFNLQAIFDKFLGAASSQTALDAKRDLQQEIIEQTKNEKWYPNVAEIFDFISIGRISKEKQSSLMGAGLKSYFSERHPGLKHATNLLLLCLYFGLFVGYSLIDYYQNKKSLLGMTTSITVAIIDFFVILMFSARVVT
jgi:hypothetical protein